MRAFWLLVFVVIVIGSFVASIYIIGALLPIIIVVLVICFAINAAMTWYQKKTQ